jgi:hypothetical protein
MFDQAMIDQLTNQFADVVRRLIPIPGVAQRYMSRAQAGEYMA